MDIKEHVAYVVRNSKIPDWDDYFMSIAILVSSRAPFPKTGAVIVSENRIISTGYSFPIVFPTEINNLSIYITDFPSLEYFNSIIGAGIHTIYYMRGEVDESIIPLHVRTIKLSS